jgi:hypothetical protein
MRRDSGVGLSDLLGRTLNTAPSQLPILLQTNQTEGDCYSRTNYNIIKEYRS